MPPDAAYDVDPAFVHELAAGLRRVRTAMDGSGRLRPELIDLGSPLVAQALHEAAASWSTARRRIGEEVSALARAADLAAGAYASVEGGVAAALGDAGRTGPSVREVGR
jgi:hypothetical protein